MVRGGELEELVSEVEVVFEEVVESEEEGHLVDELEGGGEEEELVEGFVSGKGNGALVGEVVLEFLEDEQLVPKGGL